MSMNFFISFFLFWILIRVNSHFYEKFGDEFHVNTYTDYNQFFPSTSSLSNDMFVITWQSYRPDIDGNGIYAQIFNNNGMKYEGEFLVNTEEDADNQLYPEVTSLDNDNFVITWVSYHLRVSEQDNIRAKLFYNNGTPHSDEFSVNTYVAGSQTRPTISSLSDGNFVITWRSWDQDGDNYGIYAQIFNNDGTTLNSEFQVNDYNTSAQIDPSVSSLSNWFVITWGSDGQDLSGYGIYAQIFYNNGEKFGSEFRVNNETMENQMTPSVASLSNDKFIIAWHSAYQDGNNSGVYSQIFNNDGTKFSSEFQVNTYTANSQMNPSITSLYNGDMFVITWQSDGQDSDSYGIYAQIFYSNGTKTGNEFQVNSYSLNEQNFPSTAALYNSDRFVITWQSNGGVDETLFGIFAQLYELVCDAGYYKIGESCIECATGYFSLNGTINDCVLENNATNCYEKSKSDNICLSCITGYGCSGSSYECTECSTGYYSINGTTDPCSTENNATNCYEKSKTDNLCLSCITGYGYSEGECTECSTGYYSLNETSDPCNTENTATNCYEKSKTDNLCVSCIAGFGFSTGICTECSTGYYSINGTTDPCNTENTATSCYEESKIEELCVSCIAGYGYSTGNCTECPTGYYSLNGTTDHCVKNTANNCYEESKTNNKCISCLEGYDYSTGNCNIACVACNSWSFNGTTSSCFSFTEMNCSTCSTTSDSCLNCIAGYGFNSGSCSACTDCVTYAPGGTSNCLSLTIPTAGCDECSLSTDACKTCDPSWGFVNSSLCVSCTECLSYSNGGTSDCNLFTKSNCDSCSTSDDSCLSCEAGYGLSSGSCSACTTGTYNIAGATDICQNNTAMNCWVQSTLANKCISCLEGYGYLDGECTECDDCITYSTGGTSVCLSLTISTTGCDECSLSTDACNTCDSSWGFVNSSLCVACPECVSYSNGGESVCNSFTKSNCYSCSTTIDMCLSCEAGYGLISGTCTVCSLGSFSLVAGTDACLPNTASNCAIKSKIANECLSCPEGYGFNYENGTCIACVDGTRSSGGTNPCTLCSSSCIDCDQATAGCYECSDPEFRFSGPKGAAGTICFLDCPTGYFGADTSVCKLCPEYLNVTCLTCDSDTGGCTTCQQYNEWLSGAPGLWNTRCGVDCPEDKVKDIATGSNASCIDQCPDGQHPDQDVVCIDCDSFCVTCDSNAGGCLTCKEEGEWLSGPPGISGTLCVKNCEDKVKDYASGATSQCLEECEPGYRANANEVCPTISNSTITMIYIGGGLLLLSLLIILVIVIGKKRNIRNQQPFTLITVFIAIYDFITDVLLLNSISSESDVIIHYYIGSSLMVLSVLINLVLLFRILSRQMNDEKSVFKIWLKDRTAIFGLILFISTTNMNVCSLWTSRLCGLRVFDAPLGEYEYQLKGLGVVSHVIEDIPQLAIQLAIGQKLYGLSFGELYLWPPLLILSLSATILSLICGVFSRGLFLCMSSNSKPATATNKKTIGNTYHTKNPPGVLPQIETSSAPDLSSIQLEMPIVHPELISTTETGTLNDG